MDIESPEEGEVGQNIFFRLREHSQRGIDAEYFTVRHPFGQLAGQSAVAATEA